MSGEHIAVCNGVRICMACLKGIGEECHTPGCALCRSRSPDIPIIQSILDMGGEIMTEEFWNEDTAEARAAE